MTYELMINGESFLVEADQLVRVESRDKPGVVYDVALRIAPKQRVRLSSVQFEYLWPADVELERQGASHSARIRHELGYSVLITDLGARLEEDTAKKALDILRESTVESLTGSGALNIEVSKDHERRFGHSDGLGLTIKYQDEQEVDHTCLVYVLSGESFSCSAILHYLDRAAGHVLSQMKATLDSIRPAR
jgi:hypothetical protein